MEQQASAVWRQQLMKRKLKVQEHRKKSKLGKVRTWSLENREMVSAGRLEQVRLFWKSSV